MKGEVAGAIAAFQAALKIDPDLDLDPRTENTIEKDPGVVAQELAAFAKLREGDQLAEKGEVEKALQSYVEAEKLDPSLATDAKFLVRVSWFYSHNGQAAKALIAGEKAVELATAIENDPYLVLVCRDRRGLARALTGDWKGAIEDFEAVISSDGVPRKIKAQRQEWVDALRKGQQPFTPQLLAKMRRE